MKKSLLLLIVLSCVVFANAADDKSKPDFSGNWTLDKSKSDLGQFARGNLANAAMTMSINYKEPELKMIRHIDANGQDIAQNYTYYTDGRGETNPGLFNSSQVKSKTKWEGTKLVSRSSATVTMRTGENVYIDTTEKRELSADGNTMTITVMVNTPQRPQTFKLVFTRATS